MRQEVEELLRKNRPDLVSEIVLNVELWDRLRACHIVTEAVQEDMQVSVSRQPTNAQVVTKQ